MDRLTFRVHDGGIFVKEPNVKTFDVEDEIMHTGNAIWRLSRYEDLEMQLQEVYGECDGLLEESVKYLVEHEKADVGKLIKSRLLTDDTADKWLRWKELEAEGRLLELPCKVGDKYYTLDLPIIEKPEQCVGCKYFRKKNDSKDYDDCSFYELNNGKNPKCLVIVEREFKRLRGILSFMENGFQWKTQFLNRCDAEKVLEEMKNEK